jgi:hypothetical protein
MELLRAGAWREAGVLQAAEKLNFSESAKSGSHQNGVGTIRNAWLMVFHPSKSTLSPIIRSFSATCLSPAIYQQSH